MIGRETIDQRQDSDFVFERDPWHTTQGMRGGATTSSGDDAYADAWANWIGPANDAGLEAACSMQHTIDSPPHGPEVLERWLVVV